MDASPELPLGIAHSGLSFSVKVSDLVEAVGAVVRVLDARGVPVLSQVRIEALPGAVRISATNTEMWLTSTVAAEVTGPAVMLLPGVQLHETIRRLPATESVSIVAPSQGEDARVTCKRFRATLRTLAEDTLLVPDLTGSGARWTMNAKALKRMLEQVAMCCSMDETRPWLTGPYLHRHENALCAAGLNMAVLGLSQVEMAVPEIACIIPPKASAELRRMLDDGEAEVTVTEQQIQVTCGGSTLISKLIWGEYPDYRKIMPKWSDNVLRVPAAELRRAIEAAALYGSSYVGKGGRSGSRFVIEASEEATTVRGGSTEKGDVSAEVDGASYTGALETAEFLSVDWLSILATMSDTVIVSFGDIMCKLEDDTGNRMYLISKMLSN